MPQQQQQQQALPLPGSGKSLFDQIVNRINTGHRDNARRKQQNQVCYKDLTTESINKTNNWELQLSLHNLF